MITPAATRQREEGTIVEQLSGTDSFMLYSERGNVYNHVGCVGIYDPSTAPGGRVRFKDILKFFGDRLDSHKLFRRRLVSVPLNVDRPYWVDDGEVDLEFPIRHIALPEPGDWRQLMIQVARIHSRPLDRSRPLWEVYVIEGLGRIPGMPPDAFAILQKYHHASVDGQSAGALIVGMHTLTPDAAGPAPSAVVYAERDPTAAELYSRALANSVSRTAGISSLYLKTVGRVAGVKAAEVAAQLVRRGADTGPAAALPGFAKAPATRFNATVSANRVVEAVGFPVDAMKRARAKLPGVTVNDLFLAVVGGGLHHYLKSKGELPGESMVALMPMSLRSEAKTGASGNQVGGVPVRVHSEIADPLARLAACHDHSESAKAGSEVLGRDFLKNVMDELPHAVTQTFMKHFVFPQLNTTVSNARGPDQTLYLAGAVACRNMMSDPGFYADCLRRSWDELIAAIDALPAAGGTHKIAKGARERVVAKAKPAAKAKTMSKAEPKPVTKAKTTLASAAKPVGKTKRAAIADPMPKARAGAKAKTSGNRRPASASGR